MSQLGVDSNDVVMDSPLISFVFNARAIVVQMQGLENENAAVPSVACGLGNGAVGLQLEEAFVAQAIGNSAIKKNQLSRVETGFQFNLTSQNHLLKFFASGTDFRNSSPQVHLLIEDGACHLRADSVATLTQKRNRR